MYDEQITTTMANIMMELMEQINTLPVGSQEYLRAMEALEKLHSMGLANVKASDEYYQKEKEFKEDRKFRWLKLGMDAFGVIAPLAVAKAVLEEYMESEINQMFVPSPMIKTIINWIIPRKK